jgi:glutamate dehydrogenase
MTVNPGAMGPLAWAQLSPDTVDAIRQTYLGAFSGPHSDADQAGVTDTAVPDAIATDDAIPVSMLAAQFELGSRRQVGETKVAIVPGPGGGGAPDGAGPALQVVTDQAAMLMDSVTVLLHSLGLAYLSIMNPVFVVTRGPDGDLRDIRPAAGPTTTDGAAETWIHVDLMPSVDRGILATAEELIPKVLAEGRQVALDAVAMWAALTGLADAIDSDTEQRFPGPDRADVAELLRWLADGHFILLGYQRCPVHDGRSSVDESSRLGVLKFHNEALPLISSWCARTPAAPPSSTGLSGFSPSRR